MAANTPHDEASAESRQTASYKQKTVYSTESPLNKLANAGLISTCEGTRQKNMEHHFPEAIPEPAATACRYAQSG